VSFQKNLDSLKTDFMFNEFIRFKLERKVGRAVKSEADCRNLALWITENTCYRISEQTLIDFFGIHTTPKEPKLYTVGVLANYLGYDSAEDLRLDYNATLSLGDLSESLEI
jgi:hypothetical protein